MKEDWEFDNSKTYMNFVFISPHFPHTYWQFCRRLKQNGVRVLGIADTHYDLLQSELKEALTEYYRVGSLENYVGHLLTDETVEYMI